MPEEVNNLLSRSIGKFNLSDVLSAAVVLLVCLLLVRLLLRLAARVLRRTKLEERVRRYVLGGLKIILYILTAVFTAGSLGVDMTSLVALLSVCSLGITLAAEDILGNVAGGLVILSSHPFSIGDFIEVNGTSGTVEEITMNHTKLVTLDGLMALLPNKELAGSKVINYTVLGRRRITWTLGASYDAPTETVKAACQLALAETPRLLADPAPSVCLTNYGDSAIEYTVYCWTETADFWTAKCELGERLREAFHKLGVEITYQHLNVHIVTPKNPEPDA
ncbi:MAG: mechanosensitive ion channel family protein [Oscillibacter sp.]|nr:mechanosensitive ion channel family protein [Oscillibacter sp.]